MSVPPPFRLSQGLAGLRGRRSVLIYMHDNPDPDALAAAMGLKLLFEREILASVTLGMGGIVGRAENRAMVEALAIPLSPVESLDLAQFDAYALVDSQPETGNNSLPTGHRLDVVVDHHPLRPASTRAPWCDVRPDRGATCSIVLEYLRERQIAIDPALATGFFFALRTETRDLGRMGGDPEREAYLALVPLVDHPLLYRISHPKVPREHFAALHRALRSAELHGEVVAVNLGQLGYPDLVAELAELFLALERARYVLCMGRYGTTAYLSLRTEIGSNGAGTLMRKVVDSDGAAGGHGTMAGARLFEPVPTDAALEAAFRRISGRLCESVGSGSTAPVPLVEK